VDILYFWAHAIRPFQPVGESSISFELALLPASMPLSSIQPVDLGSSFQIGIDVKMWYYK
jgi:hypothetical protein